MMAEKPGSYSREHVAGPGEKVVRSVCRPNCFGYCPHDVLVRDGKVVQSMPAHLPNQRFNRICLRGITNLQRVYDPERILYPMKRVGERGGDKWERITWEEAITTITESWKKIQAEYGDTAVGFAGGSGNAAGIHGTVGLMPRLANSIGASSWGHSLDVAISHGMGMVAGPLYFWEASGPEDLVNAKTIVLLGSNMADSNINNWHFYQDARDAGAKLIAIDPFYSNTVANCDEFIPIRPASDAALLLALTYCVIRDNKQDDEFLRRHTVAPYLVRKDNGNFLRMSDLDDKEDDSPAVIDGQGDTKAADDVTDSQLRGALTVGGFEVTTAFELLVQHLEDYTPDKASELTDIPAETIEKLYEQLISGPTTIRAGWGGQSYNNGTMVGKALMTWASVTGMISKPGCDVGAHWEMYRGINFAMFVTGDKFALPMESMVLPDVAKTQTFKGEPFPLKSMYFYQANWLNTAVDQNRYLRDVFGNLDLIVTAELAWTDTARYSDIVLPAAHWYEYTDIVTAMGSHPYVLYSEQAIEPLGEAKPDGDIARLLAKGMGVDDHFNKSDEEFMAELLDTDYSKLWDLTLDRLKAEGAVRVFPEPHIAFNGDCSFYTPDNRLHFYNENPQLRWDYGQENPVERERLARQFEPTEAWPTAEVKKTYPLNLLSIRPRYRVHGQWFSQQWLRELDPEPYVYVHPIDAAARGITNGDLIELFNDRGSTVAKAVLTEAITPGSLTYPKGWQRHQHVKGTFSELNSTTHDPIGVNSSYMDAAVEIRKWEEE